MSKLSTTLAALGVLSTLGLSTLPLASYADVVNPGYGSTTATVDDVPVSATVGSNIALELDEESVAFGTVSAGTPVTKQIKAKVTTNAKNYNLSLTAKDSTDLTGSDSNKIETGTTISDDTTKSAWGYKIGDGDWTALTTSGGDIASKGALAQGVGETTVTFGVAVTANQPADTYTGYVTFTATTANS